jgi:enoyl-[acyl-carrier protein] reductase I
MGLLTGKKGLIFGVANKNSIAWGIASATAAAGARLAFTYQIDRFRENLEELTKELEKPVLLPCDVGYDDQIEAVYARLKEEFGTLDFVVHCVAHARREDLQGLFRDTSRDGFAHALDVSAYSLIAVTRPAVPLMPNGGAVVTLTYLGSERAMLGYKVMGVAKAALEANVRYLAADLGPLNIRADQYSRRPRGARLRGFRQTPAGGFAPGG